VVLGLVSREALVECGGEGVSPQDGDDDAIHQRFCQPVADGRASALEEGEGRTGEERKKSANSED